MIALRAALRASCCGLPPSPEKPDARLVGRASVLTDTPLPNVCGPEKDIDMGVAFWPFMPLTLSASRPPHPVSAPSVACDIDDMNCCCWSLCENKLIGT